MLRALVAALVVVAVPAVGAVPSSAPAPREETAAYQHLIDAANAVVAVKVHAIPGARSSRNLGAALINKEGELVGIGSLFVMDAMTPGERLPGNMFVPIDLLKPVLDEMVATGRQKAGARPWLGLSSLEEDGHIKVLRVSEDGPADKAGLLPGDIILAMGGEKVERLDDFYRRLWSSGAPGVEVTLKVLHGSDIREVRVRSIDRLDFIRKKPTI